MQGVCEDAAAEGDSVLATGSGAAKMWAYYFTGSCLLANGQFDDAVKSLSQIDSIHEDPAGLRGIFYSKSLYLIAKAYQVKGDAQSAKKAYRKFLELWRNADRNMPEHKDAVVQLVSSGR
jgi:tetratricopeptide (TPR) repeat protein